MHDVAAKYMDLDLVELLHNTPGGVIYAGLGVRMHI